jgi:hypothetical protein
VPFTVLFNTEFGSTTSILLDIFAKNIMIHHFKIRSFKHYFHQIWDLGCFKWLWNIKGKIKTITFGLGKLPETCTSDCHSEIIKHDMC